MLIFCENSFCYSQNARNNKDTVDWIFVITEVMPEFSGGMNAFNEYMVKNANVSIVSYPQQHKRKRIPRRHRVEHSENLNAFFSFIIESDGSISDVRTILNKSFDIDAEKKVIRALQEMPRWNPAKQRNTPVRIQYTVGVKFLDR